MAAPVSRNAVRAANAIVSQRNSFGRRLKEIARIIEDVDNRCLAVDGPVSPTNDEITLKEIQRIYALAKGRKP